jgi:phosphatidylinositol-3-phosphatase
MDENESDIDVFPSGSNSTAAMPYLWSLAQEYGYATNWSDIGHPSLPNYLAIFAGSAEGDPDDCDPGSGCSWPGPTVMSQAIAAGGTAKIYEEGMTANCQTSNPGYYDVNHNPWPYFTDSADETECAADDVPSGTTTSGALLSDINSGNLPTVGLLKPDLADDTTDGTFATADNWLKSWIPLIQSGPDWTADRLAIVITFDESDEGAGGENVPFVMVAPGVSGVVVSQALNHYALTRFLDEVAGTSLLGNAGTEPDIAPLFGVKIGTLSSPAGVRGGHHSSAARPRQGTAPSPHLQLQLNTYPGNGRAGYLLTLRRAAAIGPGRRPSSCRYVTVQARIRVRHRSKLSASRCWSAARRRVT